MYLPVSCRATNRVQALAAAWQQQHNQPHRQQQQQQCVMHDSQQLRQPAAPSQGLVHCAPESLLMAIEGGVLRRRCGGLYCFAWAAVQLAGGGEQHWLMILVAAANAGHDCSPEQSYCAWACFAASWLQMLKYMQTTCWMSHSMHGRWLSWKRHNSEAAIVV